jgi:hypothetical protein
MKKLTTVLIVLLTISLTSTSFAQKFCAKTGLNLSKMLIKDNDENYGDNTKINTGFHVGATIQFPISEKFSFETGLLLSKKGMTSKIKELFDGETIKYKSVIDLYYLDIPLLAKVTFEKKKVSYFGEIGPYFGLGLKGKIKTEYTYNEDTESSNSDIEWGSDKENDQLKRIDYGLTIGVGIIIINTIQIGLSYDLGLANISSYTEGGSKVKNRVFKISIGYRFGKK